MKSPDLGNFISAALNNPDVQHKVSKAVDFLPVGLGVVALGGGLVACNGNEAVVTVATEQPATATPGELAIETNNPRATEVLTAYSEFRAQVQTSLGYDLGDMNSEVLKINNDEGSPFEIQLLRNAQTGTVDFIAGQVNSPDGGTQWGIFQFVEWYDDQNPTELHRGIVYSVREMPGTIFRYSLFTGIDANGDLQFDPNTELEVKGVAPNLYELAMNASARDTAPAARVMARDVQTANENIRAPKRNPNQEGEVASATATAPAEASATPQEAPTSTTIPEGAILPDSPLLKNLTAEQMEFLRSNPTHWASQTELSPEMIENMQRFGTSESAILKNVLILETGFTNKSLHNANYIVLGVPIFESGQLKYVLPLYAASESPKVPAKNGVPAAGEGLLVHEYPNGQDKETIIYIQELMQELLNRSHTFPISADVLIFPGSEWGTNTYLDGLLWGTPKTTCDASTDFTTVQKVCVSRGPVGSIFLNK